MKIVLAFTLVIVSSHAFASRFDSAAAVPAQGTEDVYTYHCSGSLNNPLDIKPDGSWVRVGGLTVNRPSQHDSGNTPGEGQVYEEESANDASELRIPAGAFSGERVIRVGFWDFVNFGRRIIQLLTCTRIN